MFGFSKGPAPRPIPAAEAVARARAGELVVIDVREAAELRASGKAAGALHIPAAQIRAACDPASPARPAGLRPEAPVAVYCAAGGRAAAACAELSRLGYTEVYTIGGLADWCAGGGATEPA